MIRVLYAEDDWQVADMVQLYFSRKGAGCTLDVVNSGRACLAAMEAGQYDVLMLDLRMPDLDGLQVLSELSARGDPTPVIMVSGEGQHELAVRALRAGAVDCIDKNSPEFRRIHEVVERTHQRHGRRRSATTGNEPVRPHSVIFIDPDPRERESAEHFFAAGAARLRVTAEAPAALERLINGALTFDGVILGPNLDTGVVFDALRQLRAKDENLPVIMIANFIEAKTTVAAFKLGAHDCLLRGSSTMTDLGFSLKNALRRADTERLNAKLADELAALNESLAAQVTARTSELEREVFVRREAEQRAEDNASRLQALSTRLMQVQENERRALAQELHDQIGQLLTGLRFQLEAARDAAPSSPLQDALSVTGELLRSVRELSLQLRPRVLDDLGLKPALEWQTKLYQGQTGIQVELELSLPAHRLSPELETTVFRMVQEALTNVARHSEAKQAMVTVTADDSALHVEIADRGRGFDATKALARRDSLGLAGIAERVHLAGGQLEVFSRAGEGTRLHAEFSLAAATPVLS